ERERERERESLALSSQGTLSRPRRREREREVEMEIEGEEEDESSQHSRGERRRRRRQQPDDDFGNDLSIDMYDLPSTSTGGRRRERRERREGTSERVERPSGRNRKQRRSAERDDDEEMEEEEANGGESVVREERSTVRRQPTTPKDMWKFSFPDWMTEVARKRFPYAAQVGDHVVYFRQGHEVYLKAVESLFNVDAKMMPKSEVEMEEFAIVEDVKYLVGRYRLTQLKLARTDAEGRRTGFTWTVKHHDMENVADFIILRAFYEEGLAMGLDVGDEIEAAMEDQWWTGIVENMNKNETYPNARWQSIGVRWENGDDEGLSPWDVRKKANMRRSSQPVTEDEITTLGSVPYCDGDWPEGDDNGDTTRRRIKRAINLLSECETVKVFSSAVPLDEYPDYPSKVPYPMNLQTICDRIDNQYYRRLSSLLQDIRIIALSAEAYNLKDAPIVKNAKVLVEALVRFTNDPTVEDVVSFFDSCYDIPDAEMIEYKRRSRPAPNAEMLAMLREEEEGMEVEREGDSRLPGWIRDAVEVLEELMLQPCCRHFATKDEANEELTTIWETCEDLRTLCDRVRGGEMSTPKEIEEAVLALVQTARNVVDSRRNEVYKDSLTLQSQFNNKFKSIITKFESIQASVSAQLGMSFDRSRRRRARDVPIHSYNTRRSDQAALTAVAIAAAAAEYDEQQPMTSTRSGARHESGYYRAMANGASGYAASEETASSSSGGRRSSGRRSMRGGTMARVEEEHEDDEVVLPSRKSGRRRVKVESETDEHGEEEVGQGAAGMHEEASVEENVEGEEEEEEGEEEDHEDDDEDYEEKEGNSTQRSTRNGGRQGKRKKKWSEEEEEDESDNYASTSTSTSTRRSQRARKRRRLSSDEDEEMGYNSRGRRQESNRPTRATTRHTQMTYDEESDGEEERVTTSVSQRGRQRRVRTYE
ncbi:hypothetical protein PFISCL1PPCAC_20212, partial [Pristionchus fissidentatus]